MFSSLANRNFRNYFYASSLSVIGTFGQELAVAWLVLDLTHSAAALGIAVGLNFLPMFVVAPYGGVLSDRFNRLKLLLITQSGYAIVALTLWALVGSGHIQIWAVYALILAQGLVGSLNTPTRLAFMHELVGEKNIHNAVSLNGSVYSAGRVLGPALAGILITLWGVAPVILLNALSYVGMIFVLWTLDLSKLQHVTKITNTAHQLQNGLRYVKRTPLILATLLMVLIVGIFTYEYIVTLPALAKITFHGSAATLAVLTSAYGLGAVLGGLYNARLKRQSPSQLPLQIVFLGLSALLVAIQPNLALVTAAVVIYGFCIMRFSTQANSIIQLNSEPALRGRILALYTSAWVGSSAIGAPIIGWIAQHAGPRWAMTVGGVAAIAAAGLGATIMRSTSRRSFSA